MALPSWNVQPRAPGRVRAKAICASRGIDALHFAGAQRSASSSVKAPLPQPTSIQLQARSRRQPIEEDAPASRLHCP